MAVDRAVVIRELTPVTTDREMETVVKIAHGVINYGAFHGFYGNVLARCAMRLTSARAYT